MPSSTSDSFAPGIALPGGSQDRVLGPVCWGAALMIAAGFVWILAGIVSRGLGGLDWAFLIGNVEDAGRAGGIGPVIVSTLWILAICMLAALPLGLGTAIVLAEERNGHHGPARWVRRSLDVLSGVPSIVFALFGNAFFCIYLGFGYSILAGGLTLACMVLPILIRTAEDGLRAVPESYRLGAAALGMSRTATLWRVLLPTAIPAILVALVLVVGRALSETAALLFTSGYVTRMPGSAFDSGRAMSVHIYDLAMNVPGGEAHAASTTLVLVALLLVMNGLATWGGRRFQRKLHP